MNSDYLFVYGTLLKDTTNNEMSKFLDTHAEFLGRGYFKGRLYKVAWYPGAVNSDNESDKVYGALFKLNNFDSVFKVLDAYEGISENDPDSSLFKRELVTAFLDDGRTLKTWVYLYNQLLDGLPCIESGDFLKL
ncbi:gamma-glutamylcyclotransferase [Algibacter amylolyticus]|uniref:Gamma-glutamylcyclotransferase n=1 Tax=Algibacter amylolyticus TaxID=1608400 RepID=A0A5M7B4L2_9FLAO|nr:gamma-glutamylcyclotransferase family protein [Algibacter amylolyticus]KAA5822285.1 gamma-glutamylcyclotransferase [Algibacter amylolyticus]MBB5268995.1 gamma-glutamylcyclotransferase (GGCT)/AIG2-like uncharacterized protein YtfP [Algibacter amylolyticus]TSJ73435.1 gamma-glutamylcyclotransferase [Algibacter amylolyticus]